MLESKEILLVEDHPNSLELTLRALKDGQLANYVRVARDGAEALDFLFCRGAYASRDPHDPPVLVLLDLKLPKVGGLEILRQVRANDMTRLIPVVVLTASSAERDIVQSYEAGANGYIVKPVDFVRFSQVVQDVGRYWLSLNVPPTF